MSGQVYEADDGAFRVELQGQVLEALAQLCRADPSRETGGVLIGMYSADRTTAVITEATGPPPDSRRSRSSFVRGASGLKELLRERWADDPRTHYVGEWHLHPANVRGPSDQDLRQMRAVAADSRYDCVRPVLVIVYPGTNEEWSRSVFVIDGDSPPISLR